MSNPISIYACDIPIEYMQEVFNAFAKLGDVNGIEIDTDKLYDKPSIEDLCTSKMGNYGKISATLHYRAFIEETITQRLYSGDSCDLFLKNCIITYVWSQSMNPKTENQILRNKIQETLEGIEECKEYIQSEMMCQLSETSATTRLNKIRKTLEKCIDDLNNMRNPEKSKTRRKICRGCEDGIMNQEGHYGGCIEEQYY